MNYTELNVYEEHPLKHQLDYYGVRQFDLAKSLQISQSSLSRMLNGVGPMKEATENEIQSILNFIKAKNDKAKKRKKIIK
ncbi:MAG: hypothetical protein KKG10_09735 [Proteobacteria bacterium]|nr:hypothetical protein [Pseudomonadota bacterium]